MGERMKCVTTPKTGVTRGDANTSENRCVTTPTPKGGWGGGEAASPVPGGGDAIQTNEAAMLAPDEPEIDRETRTPRKKILGLVQFCIEQARLEREWAEALEANNINHNGTEAEQ